MTFSVGIDAIAAYIPRLAVDLMGPWAQVRAQAAGQTPLETFQAKLRDGIGITEFAVCDGHEDSATMAAMACKRLIDQTGIDPRHIGLLVVGTETGVDQSKSMGAYVLGMLEACYHVDLSHIGCPQVQFACLGAMYGLEMALWQMHSKQHPLPYSLVVATDIAKYPLASAGEPTQGAGAVAMLISHDPRLMVLTPSCVGTITENERDFFRPNWSSTAVVDGKYSLEVYLRLISKACASYLQQLSRQHPGSSCQDLLQSHGYWLWHLPFPRMAQYATSRLLSLIGPKVFAEHMANSDQQAMQWHADEHGLLPLAQQGRGRDKWVASTELFARIFADKVAPSLALARRVGNMYTGSLPLGLLSLLEHLEQQDVDPSGRQVLLAGYGSGASAKVFGGTLSPRWHEKGVFSPVSPMLRPVSKGGRRTYLSLQQYERLHRRADLGGSESLSTLQAMFARQSPPNPSQWLDWQQQWLAQQQQTLAVPESICPPQQEFVLANIGQRSQGGTIDLGYRYYQWHGG